MNSYNPTDRYWDAGSEFSTKSCFRQATLPPTVDTHESFDRINAPWRWECVQTYQNSLDNYCWSRKINTAMVPIDHICFIDNENLLSEGFWIWWNACFSSRVFRDTYRIAQAVLRVGCRYVSFSFIFWIVLYVTDPMCRLSITTNAWLDFRGLT